MSIRLSRQKKVFFGPGYKCMVTKSRDRPNSGSTIDFKLHDTIMPAGSRDNRHALITERLDLSQDLSLH